MRDNIEGARLRKVVQEDAETNLLSMQTVSGTYTVTPNHPPTISLDPGVAAINVVMYTPNPASISPAYNIINRAAATGTLVVKQADGSTTVFTCAVGKIGIVMWDGVTWRGSSLP